MDLQTKTAAAEVNRSDVPILPVLDKTEVMSSETKKEITNKWKLIYSCSEKTISIQDIYTKVGKETVMGKKN